MDNYAIAYLLLIVGGLLLGGWYLIKSVKKKSKEPELPPPESEIKPSLKPVKSDHTEVIKSIYRYSEKKERMKKRVWVCMVCEVENNYDNENCFICGSAKQDRRKSV